MGKIIKSVLHWFTLQPDKKYEASHFKKDEDGKSIYYPWGYPGDAYYVNESQQKKLIALSDYAVLMILVPFLLFLGLDLAILDIPIFTVSLIVVNIVGILGCLLLYLFTRQLVPYEVNKYQSQSQSQKVENRFDMVKEMIIAAVVQSVIVYCEWVSDAPYDSLSGIFLLLTVILYPLLIIFVWVRKGYIFQKKPSSL